MLEWHKYILSPKSAIKYDDGPNQFYKINWKSFQDKLKECYLQLVLFYCKKCTKVYVSICHVVHSTASREKSALFYQEFSEIIDFSRTKWNMNYTSTTLHLHSTNSTMYIHCTLHYTTLYSLAPYQVIVQCKLKSLKSWL